MNKLTSIAIIAGLVAATTMSASAQSTRSPNYPRSTPATDSECTSIMGHMRSVNRADIESIRHHRIALIPVCEDLTVAGRSNYGPLFINGNVETVRIPIARNRTLMSALMSQDYDQFDVVALRFGANDSVILYVRQRDMR
jgi:hypothetical protein